MWWKPDYAELRNPTYGCVTYGTVTQGIRPREAPRRRVLGLSLHQVISLIPGRLVAGQRTLNPSTEVRILPGEPESIHQ